MGALRRLRLRVPKFSPSPACGRRRPDEGVGQSITSIAHKGWTTFNPSPVESGTMNIMTIKSADDQYYCSDTVIRPSGTFSHKREKGKPGDGASRLDRI